MPVVPVPPGLPHPAVITPTIAIAPMTAPKAARRPEVRLKVFAGGKRRI